MYVVGSIYIKREPIIVLIEQDLGHEMGFGFKDLISKMVREKLLFNMLLLILLLLWLKVGNGCLTEVTLGGLSNNF